MHMADALISHAVGGSLWGVSSGAIAWCAKKVKETRDDRLVPLMGVLGAFIFTAQMVNFTVPGTGSSGHLGGGLILAILLGPYAALLVIASVLAVQSLFFADGGLLALGCNIFNMGVIPAFIAYPLFYRPIASGGGKTWRWLAALVASVIGLQMGAFGVVLETKASGISALPFKTFLILMQPIHLAIGLVEGLATAVIIGFVASARPEVLAGSPNSSSSKGLRSVCFGLLLAAILIGGILSGFASKRPDGLEWAIKKITGETELPVGVDGVHKRMAHIQERTAILPDYGFKTNSDKEGGRVTAGGSGDEAGKGGNRNGGVQTDTQGTSLSGMFGGLITLAACALIGYILNARRKTHRS